jgi:diguanylate cyclase (GGDEF)-like protein
MKSLATKKFYYVVILAFIALLVNAAIPIYSLNLLKISNQNTLAARLKIELLDNVLLNMVDAETGMRGYLITGNTKFLQPYFNSLARVNLLLPQLEQTFTSSESSREQAQQLEQKIKHSLERIEDTISVRQMEGEEAAIDMVIGGEGKKRMDAVRTATANLRLHESNILKDLEIHQAKVGIATNIALIFLTIIDLALFGAAFLFLLRSLQASRTTESDLNQLHEETLAKSRMLSNQNYIKSLQARLNEVLQTVYIQEEAYVAISTYCNQLFPQYAGALYIKSHSKDYFERKSQWGSVSLVDGFEPIECWAVRSNNVYRYDVIAKELPCQHIAEGHYHAQAICIPVSTSDEMLGILTLIDPASDTGQGVAFDEELETIVKEVVGYIGLAITNLRLRENLKRSAIVDPLTGLYNRRYLNETLSREMARAQRGKQSLGIIMLDVDHFKSFNDNYGHEAGDIVLKEVGGRLKQACRASDIACRYGGEEFVLVLPEASLEIVTARAEDIRLSMKDISLMYGGVVLPQITISAGVSMSPDNGQIADALLKAADDALYQAKRNGRDQVHVYLKG